MSDSGSLQPAADAWDVHGVTRNPTSEIRNPFLDSRQVREQAAEVQPAARPRADGAGANIGPDSGRHLKKALHDIRIELRSGKLSDFPARLVVSQSLAIGPVRRHHIQAIANREDPGAPGDFAGAPAPGVPSAVVSFA